MNVVDSAKNFSKDALRFLRVALRDPSIGAVTESSAQTVDAVLAALSGGEGRIVEYGGGAGRITRELLKRADANATVFVVERNQEFVTTLRAMGDPRMRVLPGDVRAISADLERMIGGKADIVISGIPFSFFTRSEIESIIRSTRAALSDRGTFIVYQYSPVLLSTLKKYFSRVETTFVLQNFPPYFVMTARV